MKDEDRIQQEIIVWFRNIYRVGIIAHVPNENQHRLINIGVLPGFADLIVLLPNARTLFIEVKTPTGKQSPRQAKFEAEVIALGFEYYVVRTLDEFIRIFAV
jgi:hypothetical protein